VISAKADIKAAVLLKNFLPITNTRTTVAKPNIELGSLAAKELNPKMLISPACIHIKSGGFSYQGFNSVSQCKVKYWLFITMFFAIFEYIASSQGIRWFTPTLKNIKYIDINPIIASKKPGFEKK
jgi:hypothetical protein